MDVPAAGRSPSAGLRGGRSRAALAVLRAAEDAKAGRVDAIVTAPLNKESLHAAGYSWPGHTELLAEAAGTSDVAMMFVGGGLRVALLTIHQALRTVRTRSGEEVARIVRLVDRELPRLGAARRRIAVCGINPHAGEGGLFGARNGTWSPPRSRRCAPRVSTFRPVPADTCSCGRPAGSSPRWWPPTTTRA